MVNKRPFANYSGALKELVTGDTLYTGTDGLAPVRAASTAVMTWPPSGAQTVDGVSLAVGDRFLYKNSSTSGGIYIVNSGTWTRSDDMASGATLPNGMVVLVTEGTLNAKRQYSISSLTASSNPVVIDTTALKFLAVQLTIQDGGSSKPFYEKMNFVGDSYQLVDAYGGASDTLGVLIDSSFANLVSANTINAKGDVLAGTADNTLARLAVGSNGQSLMADSTASTGLAWSNSGWTLTAFYKFTSALASSGAISISAYDELMIVMRVIGMSADVPALRFNGDTGNNYSHNFLTTSNLITGTATITHAGAVSKSIARLSNQATTGPRTTVATISNRSGTSKVGTVNTGIGSGSAATNSVKDLFAQFEWVNTSAQITSVTMLSVSTGDVVGSSTFSIDSGMLIFWEESSMSLLDDTKEMLGPDAENNGWDDTRINADLLAGKTPKEIALAWWRFRSAQSVNLVNVSEGSSSRSLGDIARNAQAMMSLYSKLVDAEQVVESTQVRTLGSIPLNRV